jgi:hypothetical protein
MQLENLLIWKLFEEISNFTDDLPAVLRGGLVVLFIGFLIWIGYNAIFGSRFSVYILGFWLILEVLHLLGGGHNG